MEFARAVLSNGIEQRNKSGRESAKQSDKHSTKGDAAWRDLNFQSFGLAERPLEKLNGRQARSVAQAFPALMPRASKPVRLLRYRSSI
jgi:hypothetical protein